jgi:type I restriction enzyme R subunit
VDEGSEDDQISADNIRHFGDPVYSYDMSQGIEDGYLAACEIIRSDIFLDEKGEIEGITAEDLEGKELTDADTGEILDVSEVAGGYEAASLEARLLIPKRIQRMCGDLFQHFIASGDPEQKTIIFCVRDRHADAVATAMNNLYAAWCKENDHYRLDPYAFKCTASVGGADYIADLKGAQRHHFIATTVDLLSTGVDVPCVKNIVFFKYVRSPMAFYQMVGRGTRLDPPSGKLMFRVYDYTNATRLFGEDFITHAPSTGGEGGDRPRPPVIQVEGFDVRVSDAGRYILTEVDGKAMPVTVEEYKERLAAKLVEQAPTLESFREAWIHPEARRLLLGTLPDAGRSPLLVRALEEMDAYDLYDVLAELGYGLAPRTRPERADAFNYKHGAWLLTLPPEARETLKALASQFAKAGTDGLESPAVFSTPEVVNAGGLQALRQMGTPAEVLLDTKERMFAV